MLLKCMNIMWKSYICDSIFYFDENVKKKKGIVKENVIIKCTQEQCKNLLINRNCKTGISFSMLHKLV